MKLKLYFHILKRQSKFDYANIVPTFMHNIHEYSYHILEKSLKSTILGLFQACCTIGKNAETLDI